MEARLSKSTPGGGAESYVYAAGHLAQQSDVHVMLANEKMRSEQHKLNYQALKMEHTRLQKSNMQLESEIRVVTENSKALKDGYERQLRHVREDLRKRADECNVLGTQVLSEPKLEMLKLEWRDELEAPFHDRQQQLLAELEATRTECTRLKYENTFVKSELEHAQVATESTQHEMKLRHDAELTSLRKEREAMLTRSQSCDSDAQRVRTMQRENAQLQLRTRSLLDELEELRSERERNGLQSDHITRLQSKQLSETSANLKALQVERDAFKSQVDSQQTELSAACERHASLSARLQELERANTELRCRTEEAEHGRRVDIAESKVQALRERGDLQREKDKLANMVDELQHQVDTLRLSIEQQSVNLEEKERESVKRIQSTQEEEWQKQHALENEKLELEVKIQELNRQRIDDEAVIHAEREKLQRELALVAEAKETAEKETQLARCTIQQNQGSVDQLARVQAENAELLARLQRIELHYNDYMQSEQQVTDLNDRLRRQVESLTHAAETSERELERSKELASQVLAEQKVAASSGQLQLQTRIAELDEELAHAQTKLANQETEQSKKKKRIAKVLTKLRDKNSLLLARVNELVTENDALRQAIVPNATQTKRQLHKLMRCHEELRSTLESGGPMLHKSQLDNTALPHQKDLQSVKQRIELLNDHQRQQMEAMSFRPPAISLAKLNSAICDKENRD